MARPSLDDIFNNDTQQQRPSLDDIFGGNVSATPVYQPPDNQEKDIFDILGDAGRALVTPASTALEVISYLDKPRGALAGTVKAAQDDTSLWEGAKRGWRENTSWKETFSDDWVRENPKTAAAAGLAADIIGDPLWFLTPAKIAKGAVAGSKAAGLTDNVINPAVKAIESTDAGKSAIAALQDFGGYNRLADIQDEFKAGRATDQVLGQDVVDELNTFKKANPSNAEDITRYIEAKDRDLLTNTTIPSERAGILAAADENKLARAIQEGAVTKDQAFNILREEGREIPDFLLQEHQRAAKAAQYGPAQLIPEYVYRDEVLNAIPEPGLRKSIQSIGDKIIDINKKRSDDLLRTGRLSDEQFVRFQGGSHLRRSFEQYESPEKFMEAVRKNGTPEEWQRVYADYQTMKNSNTFGGAHKVNMKDFTGRQILSDETLQKMGVINDPAYKVMDTFNRGSKTLREDEFLSKVSQMWGVDEATAAQLSRNLPTRRQYVPMPESRSYGELAGKWVPRDVAEQVMGTLGTKPDKLNATYGKLVSWWKVGKLSNPSSIMRNFYSGLPMANVFGKVPTYALPKQMTKVVQQFTTQGGKNSPLIRELRQTGILGNVWNKQELANILGESPKGIKKIADWGMEAFGAPDKFWRAVVYSHHRDAGKSIQEAAKIANNALFDYSNAPEWVNWLSRTGVMPFAKFPFFAGKETAKALYENPAAVTKYIKPQNQVNTEDREQIMPDYLKAKTLLPTGETTRIVNGKPQKVQGNIDLSYILPFANDLSMGNPLVDALQLQRTGRNGIGQEVIKPGMTDQEKTQAWAKYLANSFGPSVVAPYTIEKLYNGAKGNVDSKGRQYEFWDAVKQVGLGVKNVPVNIDELYKQKIGKIAIDQRGIQDMMRTIARDQSLNAEQKKTKLKEHQSQLKELQKESKRVQEAYKREKKRGAI